MGDAAVVPFLRHRGIARVDALLISHGDDDHSGGASAIIDALPVARVLTSAPHEISHPRVDACQAGQHWRWDGVDFEILSPEATAGGSENDLSCVLRVDGPGGAVLLTGDIEVDAERELLLGRAGKLLSDAMLVPHHGSDTSSSAEFIRGVSPKLALVSVGYGNRWGFPNPAVAARYFDRRIPMISTGTEGALRLDVDPAAGILLHEGYRRAQRRYWTTLP